MSTLAVDPYPDHMDTSRTRITRKEAAALAGVSERTINRWSAAGDIRVWRDSGFRRPAEYDRREVLARASRGRDLKALVPPTDSS